MWPRPSASLVAALFGAAALVSIASCGSRTGLFGPGADLPDGAVADVTQPIDAPDDGPTPCVPGRFTLDLATAQLMFVVDRSKSMAFTLDGQQTVPPGEQSRWETLRDALFQTIVPFDYQLAMGAKFYPEVLSDAQAGDPTFACRSDTGVAIAPALGNAPGILNVFDTTKPNGGTPTAEALRLAAEFFVTQRTVARTMVLATDGAPNCNGDLDQQTCTCTSAGAPCSTQLTSYNCLDDGRTISVIKDIFEAKKIPVYVIGIGSTERPEFLQVLDAMAVAGGRPRPTAPRHYNVQTAAEMKTALATIRDSVAQCTYLTPSSPTDPNAIVVEVDGATIPRDPTHTNGWDWVDQDYGELAFFGPACDAARKGEKKVEGVVSCGADR